MRCINGPFGSCGGLAMDREPALSFESLMEEVRLAHPDVLLQSCVGWHAPGVTSVVLQNRNGEVRRLVLVDQGHRLYVNMPAQQLLTWPIHGSLATHFVRHVVGHVVLYRYRLADLGDPWPGIELMGGATEEERVPVECREGEVARFKLRCCDAKDMRDAGRVRIPFDSLRTWWVAKGKPAAWLVEECRPIWDRVTWFNGCRNAGEPLYTPFASASEVIRHVESFAKQLAPIRRGV